jgi:hypothetical protein
LSQTEIIDALEDLTKAVTRIVHQIDRLNLAVEALIPEQEGEKH